MPREVIVPGARDLIPPQGRVTVQLTKPDTGRIVHEVKAENMLMNCWLAQVNQHYRGAFDSDSTRNQYLPNFSPVSANNDAGFTRDYLLSHIGRAGIFPGLFNNYMPWLWASDKNIAPLATRTCPPHTDLTNGNMTGYARLDIAHATTSGRNNRGTIVPGESWHKYAQSRVSVEFATTEGNGTYRSVGIGRLCSHYNANRCGVSPIPIDVVAELRSPDAQEYPLSPPDYLGIAQLRSASFENTNNYWLSNTSHNLFIYNFQTDAVTTGPLSAAITPGGSSYVGVVIQGGQLWLSRGAYIHRCNKFTGGTLTILNSYNLATPLGAETFFDLTSDGTNLYGLTLTKVFVINPVDGTVITSWTHGLNSIFDVAFTCNIEWDPANQHLWIVFGTDDTYSFNSNSSLYQWKWTSKYILGASRLPNTRVIAFSTAGVQLPYSFYTVYGGQNGQAYGFTGVDSNGWTGCVPMFEQSANRQHFLNLASMIGSHALLPSDVVKTSANALKIVYDFDFS